MDIILGQSVAMYLTIYLGLWLLRKYLSGGVGWKEYAFNVVRVLMGIVFCYIYYIVVLR